MKILAKSWPDADILDPSDRPLDGLIMYAEYDGIHASFGIPHEGGGDAVIPWKEVFAAVMEREDEIGWW